MFAVAACGGGTSQPVKTLSSILVAPQGQSLAAGTTLQMTATGTYTDGTTGDVTSGVTWASSDMSLVSVSSSGLANALAVGRPKEWQPWTP